MAVPNAPSSLLAVPGDTQVELFWGVPYDNGNSITDYVIERSTDGSAWSVISDGTSTVPHYIVTSLTNDTLYYFRVKATNSDGSSSYSNVITATPSLLPVPEYCSVNDVANWLRVDITENTKPSRSWVQEMILMNQEEIDRRTGHSWQSNRQYREDQLHVNPIYDWGRGMPIFLKHRMIRTFDATKGDKFEIWDGQQWVAQDVSGSSGFLYFDKVKGIAYVRGYMFSILTQNRFRITYRYGGAADGPNIVPKDIKKACMLLTAIDILSTDFKYSSISYGGEGNISKDTIINKWQKKVDDTIRDHAEIFTVI